MSSPAICRRCGVRLGWPEDLRAGIHLETCWREELREAGATEHPGHLDANGRRCYGVRLGRCTWCGVAVLRVWQDGALDRWWCDRHLKAATARRPFGDPGWDLEAEAEAEEMEERAYFGDDYRPESYNRAPNENLSKKLTGGPND